MTDRTIAQVAQATPQPGTGILRPFPSPQLREIDPFVFLDTGAPMNLGTSDIYVGPHSHRGVQPVSLLFRGRIEHRDSLGNDRTVTSGGIQWLVAGSGAFHEEVLNGDDDGVFHMAQLWVNLPAAEKMKSPEHHALDADHIPEVDSLGRGSLLRLYAGTLARETGPAPLPTPVVVAHVTLEAGGEITVPVPTGWAAALCAVDGEVEAGGQTFGPGGNPVFADDGDTISARSSQGGQFLLMCGEPIGEPIVAGAGWVMNTRDEIQRAAEDEAAGRMGKLTPSR